MITFIVKLTGVFCGTLKDMESTAVVQHSTQDEHRLPNNASKSV